MSDEPFFPTGTNLVRDGDRTIVRALKGHFFYGAIVSATGVFVILITLVLAVREGLYLHEFAIGLGTGLVPLLLGILIAWPRVTLTIFDPQRALVEQKAGRLSRILKISWPLAEVAGVGVEEIRGDAVYLYEGFVRHRDGTSVRFGAMTTHFPSHAHLVDTLSRSTGLPRIEMPVNKAWFEEDAVPARAGAR